MRLTVYQFVIAIAGCSKQCCSDLRRETSCILIHVAPGIPLLTFCLRLCAGSCFLKPRGRFCNVLSCHWMYPHVHVSFVLFFKMRAIRKIESLGLDRVYCLAWGIWQNRVFVSCDFEQYVWIEISGAVFSAMNTKSNSVM